MKKYLALLLAVLMLTAMFAGCASKETTTDTPAASTETAEPTKTEETKTEEPAAEEAPASEEGKVFNIYAWNEEFKGFFEKYYTVPEGVTVNWIITPSADGAYQDKLDEALLNQESASADDKVDLFLAEADYILKYTQSPVTQDITALGVTDFSNTYAYTVQAASDASGVVKGVSFQCCPAALIYRRSIAKDVLGTDDPAEVQEKLNSWEKFNAVAAEAKAKGYLMTASEAATYRVFSNNQKVNELVAQDESYGSDFLGGQNDIALFCDLAKNIKFENNTIYDQLLNEGLQANWREYCKGTVTEDEAMSNFYKYINEKYPTIVTP